MSGICVRANPRVGKIGVKYKVVISNIRMSKDSDSYLGFRYALQCQAYSILETAGYNADDFVLYEGIFPDHDSYTDILSMFFYVKTSSEAIYHKMNGFVIEEIIEEDTQAD